MIINHAVTRPTPIWPKLPGYASESYQSPPELNITILNRQLRTESIALYHRSNDFSFEDISKMVVWLSRHPPQIVEYWSPAPTLEQQAESYYLLPYFEHIKHLTWRPVHFHKPRYFVSDMVRFLEDANKAALFKRAFRLKESRKEMRKLARSAGQQKSNDRLAVTRFVLKIAMDSAKKGEPVEKFLRRCKGAKSIEDCW